MGKHPHNTIFSYNYINVRHLNTFLKKQAAALPGEAVIADIGAGLCPYFPAFREKCTAYYAVDYKESLPLQHDPKISCIEGTAENIPLPDHSADVVISNQVLEHVQSPEKSISEIYRILKPGGVFIGSVPHISPIHLEPWDYRRYTIYGIRQLAEAAGFKTIEIEGNGGVFQSSALLLAMDWVLSRHAEGKKQKFSALRALLLFPLVGWMNGWAIILDTLLGDKKRSPSNYCWTARK